MLLRIVFALWMQHIFSPHPALESEQPQNQERARPDSVIAQSRKGQPTQYRVGNQRHGQATHNPAATSFNSNLLQVKTWCTGKDSNLRTSLGGTDLQSVGFNHSPTCANSSGDAAVALRFSRPPCRAARKRSR